MTIGQACAEKAIKRFKTLDSPRSFSWFENLPSFSVNFVVCNILYFRTMSSLELGIAAYDIEDRIFGNLNIIVIPTEVILSYNDRMQGS